MKTKSKITKHYSLEDSVGCTIDGDFTDDEMQRFRDTGKWTITEVKQ